jgi:hypothetical protein
VKKPVKVKRAKKPASNIQYTQQWELIGDKPKTWRLLIGGGALYRVGASTAFVPTPHDALFNVAHELAEIKAMFANCIYTMRGSSTSAIRISDIDKGDQR